MANIITKDSEEFKEFIGWIKRTGKSIEVATNRIRPTIADEHYLSGDEVCRLLHISKQHSRHCGMKRQYLILPSLLSAENCSIRKAYCMRC